MKNHFKVSVLGASGRMGSKIIKKITESSTIDLHFVVEHKGHGWIGQDCGEKLLGRPNNILITDDLKLALEGAEAVIDFSTPDTSLECVKVCAQTDTAHVIGTTGFDLGQENEIAEYAKKVVIVKAGNMSLGINVLTSLVEKISSSLDLDFDIEILEMHHRDKVDAPSGTALMLGKGIAVGKKKDFYKLIGKKYLNKKSFPYGKKINFNSLRKGEVIGEHEVTFSSGKEIITLNHEAFDRALYSEGALTAGKWLMKKKPGLYSMRDVLNFK